MVKQSFSKYKLTNPQPQSINQKGKIMQRYRLLRVTKYLKMEADREKKKASGCTKNLLFSNRSPFVFLTHTPKKATVKRRYLFQILYICVSNEHNGNGQILGFVSSRRTLEKWKINFSLLTRAKTY